MGDRGRNDFYKEQCNFRKGERPKKQELDSLKAVTVKGKPEKQNKTKKQETKAPQSTLAA